MNSLLVLFCLLPCAVLAQDSLTDARDGQRYSTVVIGHTKWMAANLNYETPGSQCYRNKDKHCATYGRLYPYSELLTVCPVGWRLPNEHDWKGLQALMTSKESFDIITPTGWKYKKGPERNSVGLSVVPSGRWDDGRFIQKGTQASFWLNEPENEEGILHWHVEYSRTLKLHDIHRHPMAVIETQKFSVRCVYDAK